MSLLLLLRRRDEQDEQKECARNAREFEKKAKELKEGANENEIDFLDYKTSLQRLDDILNRIKNRNSYEAAMWRTIFSAEQAVLKHLNDERLSCKIAWDKRTGLLSHPSLIADVQKYTEVFKPAETQKAALQSLVGWTRLGQQTISCACGRGFKMRMVTMDFMLNTLLRVDNKALLVKQLVGVRTDDPSHLAHHYDCGRLSQQIDNCRIVFESESKISMRNRLLIKRLSQKNAGQFNAAKFVKLMTRSLV